MDKNRTWGGRRTLEETELKELERHYAHFHRVLGPLLVELGELPGTVWLDGDARHELAGEGEENKYARAIYIVNELEPYRERLSELEAVRQGGAALLEGESPAGLLPPKVIDGVKHVRISQHPNYVTQNLSHAGATKRLAAALEATKGNLRQFEAYASLYDPRREAVEREVEALEDALQFARARPDERFRFRTPVRRVRPYVYPLRGDPYQADTRKHGLLLAGPGVTVRWDDPTRKTRSDKKVRTPFLKLEALQVYLESEWQAG